MEDRKMIFISGKITGDDNYVEKFNKAKEKLKKLYPDYSIISPTDIDLIDVNYEKCLNITLNLVENCDIIYLLNDWFDSYGAKQEAIAAKYNDLEFLFESQMEENND